MNLQPLLFPWVFGGALFVFLMLAWRVAAASPPARGGSPAPAPLLMGSAGLLFAAGWAWGGWAGGLALAALGASGLGAARAWRRRSRERRLQDQWIETLDALGGLLRSGFGIEQALARLAGSASEPMRRELALWLQELGMGASFSDALAHLGDRLGFPDALLAVAAIRTAHESGGSLSLALGEIASTLRQRRELDEKLRTLTAQGKMQAVVVGLLPFALGGFLAWTEPESVRLFVDSRTGQLLLSFGVLLEAAGLAWIWKIVQVRT